MRCNTCRTTDSWKRAHRSWVTYRHHLQLIKRFRQRCLRTILNIHWNNFVTKSEVLKPVKIISIETMPPKFQLRRAGHISGMGIHCSPQITLYSELSTGYRGRGTPSKWYKICLKSPLIPIPSIIANEIHSWEPWHLVFHNQQSFSPLKMPIRSPSRTKGTGERTVTLYNQALTKPSAEATAAVSVSPSLACSATNVLAVSVDHLFWYSLSKLSHENTIFTNPSVRTGYDTRSILSGLNSEYSFS